MISDLAQVKTQVKTQKVDLLKGPTKVFFIISAYARAVAQAEILQWIQPVIFKSVPLSHRLRNC